MSRPEGSRWSRTLLRRGVPVLAVLLLAALLVLVLDRNRDDADPAPAAAAPSSTAAATEPAPSPAGEPTGEVTQPADPAAGTTPGAAEPTPAELPDPATEPVAEQVVVREGVDPAARTVTADPAPFTAPAAWSDGASVRVVDARQQVSTGTGPGALVGQPQTVFTLEVRNGASTPLDLNAVVVQATYGADAAQAGPLYDAETVDFSGSLAAGATASAVYSFAIPADQLGAVELSVDVDGHRFPAVFTGAVPTS